MYEVAKVEILKKMRGSSFCSGLVQCAKNGKKVIIDERAVNGLIMHILIRRIAVNPVTGVSAMLLAILGMNEGEDTDGVFTLSYRICPEGEPIYVHMKIVPIKMKGNSIVIGISNITAQMKEQEAIERIKEENLTYSRLMALSENYVSIFIVDPDTDEYFSVAGKESATRTNEIASAGNDFYSYFLKTRRKYVAIADLEYVSNQFTKDNIIKKINEKGIFILKYRFVLNDELRYAVLKAAFIEEKGVKRLIIGIRDEYIKKGCNLICNIFRHCPVFRIGGDEFVAIVQGRSYQFIDKIMEVWNRSNQENLQNRDIVIAAGVARYDGEKKLEDVFQRLMHSCTKTKEC